MSEPDLDGDSIAHVENCTDPDCERCDHLSEFLMGCDGCGSVGHMDSFGWEMIDGLVYCPNCAIAKATHQE